MQQRPQILSERVKFALILQAMVAVLVWGDWLWRGDQMLYDLDMRLWTAPAPDDVVIVAIDEASLKEVGRWPWPRRIHADLVQRLSAAGAKVISLDIIFAEDDMRDRTGDIALTQALRDSGRVVLPLVMEQPRLGGQILETLPIPALAQASAALGHAHIELDLDGIARRVYLQEGLGAPRWPHLSLATLNVSEGGARAHLPGVRRPGNMTTSPYIWARDYGVLIPYFGPSGQFKHISYSQVLKGNFAPDTFRNKIVLVGVTATGLGDALPTPVSGLSHPMSGVEINANIFAALRMGKMIEPMDTAWRWMLAALIVLLPPLLFPYLAPRWALIITVILGCATFVLSVVVLRAGMMWFPPMAVLVTVACSYPLWSWRRLEYTLGYLDQELARLRNEPDLFPTLSMENLEQALPFLRYTLPVTGLTLYDPFGQKKCMGEAATTLVDDVIVDQWKHSGETLWTGLPSSAGMWRLGVTWKSIIPPSAAQHALLLSVIRPLAVLPTRSSRGAVEHVQARVQSAQDATARLRTLRRFISDSVAQMAEGVLVVTSLGQVVLFNSQAALYFMQDNNADLNMRALPDLLESLQVSGADVWDNTMAKVLLQHATVAVQARHVSGRDLLIKFAPLMVGEAGLSGLIVNIADISALKDGERKREEVLGFLSHDLRAPLVSSLALLELMRSGYAMDIDTLLKKMEANVHKTLSLAEDFVQLSKVESGENLHMQEVDLASIAKNALDQVWGQATTKGMHIEARYPDALVWVHGEPHLLERVMINLLTNAIKYSPQDSLAELTLEVHDGEAHCCIRDNGYGIATEDIPRLFGRFRRIYDPDHQHIKGVGLGLAFVLAVIDRHGGHIAVTSTPGQGSRFCITLPTAQVVLDQ